MRAISILNCVIAIARQLDLKEIVIRDERRPWLLHGRVMLCCRRETGAPFSCHMREAPMSLSVATTSGRRAAGAIEVIPTGAALGAEVRGVDLTHLDEAAFARVDAGLARPFGGAGPRSAAQRSGPDRVQPPLGRSRLGAHPGDRAPVRRGAAGDLYRLQRQGERRANRQPRRRRSGVAHRHVLSRRAAEGEHALCARGAAHRRQYFVLHHVWRLRGAAGRR